MAAAITTAAKAGCGKYCNKWGRPPTATRWPSRPRLPSSAFERRPLRPPACVMNYSKLGSLEKTQQPGWRGQVPPSPGSDRQVSAPRRIDARKYARICERNKGHREASDRTGTRSSQTIRGCGVRANLGAGRAPTARRVARSKTLTNKVAATTAIKVPGTRRQRFRNRMRTRVPPPMARATTFAFPAEYVVDDCPRLAQRSVCFDREAEKLGELAQQHGKCDAIHVAVADRLREQLGNESEPREARRTQTIPETTAIIPASAIARCGSPAESGATTPGSTARAMNPVRGRGCGSDRKPRTQAVAQSSRRGR